MRTVVLHRWQVVAAFLLLVVVSVVTVQVSDYRTNNRIDEAEKRITVNAAKISAAKTSAREALVRDRKICQETNKVKAQIVTALRRTLKTTPTLAYYREHPAELRSALASTQQTVRELAPTVCPPEPR